MKQENNVVTDEQQLQHFCMRIKEVSDDYRYSRTRSPNLVIAWTDEKSEKIASEKCPAERRYRYVKDFDYRLWCHG